MEEIDALRISLGRKGTGGNGSKGIKKLIIDFPEKVSINFVEKFQTLLIKNASDNWFEMYGLLLEYVKENGHSRVPTSNIKRSRHNGLGIWVSNQRVEFKKGTLKQERIELLEKIDDWVWKPKDNLWEKNYKNLRNFIEKNGHARVNVGTSLYNFCSGQRTFYNKGTLEEEYINALNKLDGWEWDVREADWMFNFQELKKFFKKNGHINPKKGTTLHYWIRTQKTQYKKKSYSEKRISLLNGIEGWEFDSKLEIKRKEMFEKLKDFLIKNGHARVSYENDMELAKWINYVRNRFIENKLSNTFVDLMNDLKIHGWTWEIINPWDESFLEVELFIKTNGHCEIPFNYPKLGKWTSYQRSAYRKGDLSKERIQKLNTLSGWVWDLSDKEWQKRFSELNEFKNKNGHISPNTKNTALGRWCSAQRKNQKKGKLSLERFELLNGIGFTWN